MDIDYWVRGLYVMLTIFGAGVTAIEFLGLWAAHHDGGHDIDGGGLNHPLAVDHAVDHDAQAPDAFGEAASQAELHHGPQASAWWFLLRYLRRGVFFSLGFGPAGLAATAGGARWPISLMWAVPAGLASLLLAGAIFRFQQRDVDSTVSDRELFYEPAEVTVAIAPGQMGRVRVVVGNSPIVRFARTEDPTQSIQKGERVYITQVRSDCVLVSRPQETTFLRPSGPGGAV